ncbi:aminoglycoside phosphotransferase family protein [Lentzea aerocolonigenes]|uniref:aminoglycoside phosphotransferase family protein n=1 Tax=Lentzea aerocolonigenes TaxID=68170 RepID=UPI00068E07C3|nr:aminoglycoside phosphotransferase family protein [Lentzea aerocolonigenes]MCP2244412.1 streptomycin 6-kinase [Lentzea aerocolonigenes]
MIDEDARSRLIRRFGPDVTGWIDALPDLVATLAARWDLTVVKLMPGSTGTTFLCTDAVLKLCPHHEVAALEASALTAWAGTDAVVNLIDADLSRGALLLEAINPGTPAPDPAVVVPELHAADPTGFPPLAARVDFLFEVLLPLRTGTYHATEHQHARELAGHDVEPVLLHGDMHPGNVLQGPHGPVAIDPRAHAGDPAFDWMDLVHDGYDLHGADVDLDRVHEWLTAFKPFYG